MYIRECVRWRESNKVKVDWVSDGGIYIVFLYIYIFFFRAKELEKRMGSVKSVLLINVQKQTNQ